MNASQLKALIKDCRNGNRDSQKLLYQEFYAYGMSICIRYVNERGQAAEILNDAFIKVFKNIQRFDLDKGFKPWFRAIVINTAINYYHQNLKFLDNDELDESFEEITPSDALSQISYKEIIGLVQELPPQYRTVFNLFVIEGYKHEEIAEMLGIAVGTSKSNLARAKKNLQEKLNKFFLSKANV